MLIGRETERRRIRIRIDALAAGRGGLMMLVGE
jgi:hypothetical protein